MAASWARRASAATSIDKRIDVISTAMSGGITAPQLADLELAYAPMYGSAKDPGQHARLPRRERAPRRRARPSPGTSWRPDGPTAGWWSTCASLPRWPTAPSTAPINIPLDQLRGRVEELRGHRVVCACAVGQRGHAATRLLRQHGIDAANLIGGYRTYDAAARATPR